MSFHRIVCLTEETVETLYLLGQDHRIVGVTGYAIRPARVRREKPRVGAFTSADLEKIKALNPDLVLTFSDLQADIAAGLIRAGIEVHAFNHRDVAGIMRMTALRATLRPHRPRVFFEEWDEPIISGIKWVSELVEIAGGQDVFPELAAEPLAKNRILLPDAIPPRAPDVILASWCGKKVVASRISGRSGWQDVPAVAAGRIHEIKSPLILQPGPAALTDGLDAIVAALWPGDQRAAGA
jgi:iron complex transport system substrate-binding protein